MRRIRPGKLFLTLFLLGFAVFFGLDLATSGMERVQGPVENTGKPAAVAHQPEVRTSTTGAAKTAAAAGTAKNAAGATAGSAASGQSGTASKQQTTAAGSKKQKGSAAPSTAAAGQSPPKIEVKESFLNHLSNRIGDALHRTVKALMSIVVSFFNSIIS
jgi:hypothetical protein